MMWIDWMVFLRPTYLGLCSCKIWSQSEQFENFDFFWFFWWRHRLPRPNGDDENWLDDIFVIYIPWSLFVQNLKSIGAFLYFDFFLIFWWRHRLLLLPRPSDDEENWLDDIFRIYIPRPLFVQNLKSIGAFWKIWNFLRGGFFSFLDDVIMVAILIFFSRGTRRLCSIVHSRFIMFSKQCLRAFFLSPREDLSSFFFLTYLNFD